MSLNKIFIMGRLTADPELRRTQQGTAVASFTLAVDRIGKDKGTDFIPCVAWRNTADFVGSYFSKGRMAVVEGRLQIREFTDKEANKRKVSEVVVDSINFADSKKSDPLDTFVKENKFVAVDDDDDIPF